MKTKITKMNVSSPCAGMGIDDPTHMIIEIRNGVFTIVNHPIGYQIEIRDYDIKGCKPSPSIVENENGNFHQTWWGR